MNQIYSGEYLRKVNDTQINLSGESTIDLTTEEFNALKASGQLDDNMYYCITDDDLETVFSMPSVQTVVESLIESVNLVSAQVTELVSDNKSRLALANIIVSGTILDTVGKSVRVLGLDSTFDETQVMDDSLVLHFQVNKLGRYKVTCDNYEDVIIFDNHCTKQVCVDYSISTWSGIKNIINDGRERDFFKLGQIFPVTLDDGEIVKFEVVAINLCPNETPHEVIFGAMNGVDTGYSSSPCYNETNIVPSWESCMTIRNFLNETLFSKLPVDLQNVITPRILARNVDDQRVFSYTATSDKLWLPTATEVGLVYEGDRAKDHTFDHLEIKYQSMFPLYLDQSKLLKRSNLDGYIKYWKSSSPDFFNGDSAHRMVTIPASVDRKSTGCLYITDTDVAALVVPFFSISSQEISYGRDPANIVNN